MGGGVKEPVQVPKNSALVALQGDDALAAAFIWILRLIIGKPVQKTRLKFFQRRQLGHGSNLPNLLSGGKLNCFTLKQRMFLLVGGEHALAQAGSVTARMLFPFGLARQQE